MDRLIGKLVNSRYRIQSVIGMGGMAIVYRAVDVQTGATVAIKVLKQEFLADEQFRMRFENESRAVSILNHKNIVKVFDVALNDDLYYIVMEYLNGITLKQYINQQGHLGWRRRFISSPRFSTPCSTRTPRALSTVTSSRKTSCCSPTAPSK